jgi:hypothetical protein
MVSFVVISLWAAYSRRYKLSDHETAMEKLAEDWRRKVILDIKVVKANEVCPTEYSNLFSAYFPGVKEGCKCENKIFEGACSDDHDACTHIPPINWMRFDPDFKGSYTCAKLGPEIKDLEIPDSDNACSAGSVLCGRRDDPFCVIGTECPVTDILIKPKVNGAVEPQTGYTTLEFHNGEDVLYFGSIAGESPIDRVEFIEGD